MGLADFKNPAAILFIRFDPGTADGCSRCTRHHFKIVPGSLRQVDKLFLHQPFHSSESPVKLSYVRVLTCLKDSSHQRLIDNRGRAPPHGYDRLTGQFFHLRLLVPRTIMTCPHGFHTENPVPRAGGNIPMSLRSYPRMPLVDHFFKENLGVRRALCRAGGLHRGSPIDLPTRKLLVFA